MGGVSSSQRFTAANPCPVCGGHDQAGRGNGTRCFGFVSDDGRYAHCAREEYAGDIERTESSNTYAHYLGGRCKCGETHDTVGLSSEATNSYKRKGEKKQAFFDPARDTVFYYRDLANKPLYAVVRIGGDKSKTFQAHKDGDNWFWGMPEDAPNVPYRLPEVMKAILEGKTVHKFEGEPDADAARKLGLVATTNIRGAGKFTDDLAPYFRGADVVVNADNDEDGEKHRKQVAMKLHGTARSIKVMEPFAGVNDFRDWLGAGGTIEQYLEMVESAPEYVYSETPQPTSQLHSPYIPPEVVKLVSRPPLVVKRFKDIPQPGPTVDIVQSLVPEKEPTTIHGYGGTTKSYLGLDLLLSVAAGEPNWLGHQILGKRTTLYVDLELNEAEQVRRAYRLTAGKEYDELPDNFLHLAARGYTPREVFTAVYKDCEERGTEVVLIDSVGLAMIGDAANHRDVIAFHRDCLDLLIGIGVTPILIDHQSNLQAGENYQSKSAFGSSYKHNLVRSRLQVELKEAGKNHRAVILRQMKNNLGAEADPIKVLLEFEDDKVTVARRNLEHGEALEETTITLKNRVIMALFEGRKWPSELAEELNVTTAQISNTTKTLRDEGLVQRTGEQNGNSYELNLTDDGRKHYKMFLKELHNFTGVYKGNEVVKLNSGSDDDDDPPPSGGGSPAPLGKVVSILNTTPAKKLAKKKKHYTLLDLARADRGWASEFPNLIYREKQVPKILEWLKTATEISVDIETYGVAKTKGERKKLGLSFVHGKIRLLQLFDGVETYIIDAALLRPATVATILETLRTKTLIMHGGVFDLPRLKRHYGVDLMDEDLVDTMVLSRLARSGELKDDGTSVEHSLGAVLKTERVARISKDTDHEWHEPLTPERLKYATEDVRYLPKLRDALMRVVEERNQLPGLKLFMPAYREYMGMQYRGLPLDLERFNMLLEKYRTRAEDALSRVEELAPDHPDGESWSWGNKLKPDATDRHGNNTGRNGALRALQLVGIKIRSLKKESRTEYLRKHPEARLLAELDKYYRYSDLHSDAKGWLDYAVEDGRMYPNINPFSQVTCRSAYSDPAVQNIPKEPDEEGALSLRDCIRAGAGYKVVAADYAAQELRIVAHIAGDESLIEAFTKGDPHLQVAEKIAGKKLERGSAEGERYRKLGKSVNYGFTYGQGAARFQQSVYQKTSESIPEDDAKAYQKAFQETWRGVHGWQKRFGSRSGKKPEHWYTESFVGRRRYVSRKWDTELPGWKPAYTDRLNGPIQSGGADILYTAMQMLREDQHNGKLQNISILLTTHDEIALEAPEDVAEDAKVWLKTRMRDAAKQFLREELTKEDCVEGEVGDSWGGK